MENEYVSLCSGSRFCGPRKIPITGNRCRTFRILIGTAFAGGLWTWRITFTSRSGRGFSRVKETTQVLIKQKFHCTRLYQPALLLNLRRLKRSNPSHSLRPKSVARKGRTIRSALGGELSLGVCTGQTRFLAYALVFSYPDSSLLSPTFNLKLPPPCHHTLPSIQLIKPSGNRWHWRAASKHVIVVVQPVWASLARCCCSGAMNLGY